MTENKKTTIGVDKATIVLLEQYKQHPRETYEEVILRLIGATNGNSNNQH